MSHVTTKTILNNTRKNKYAVPCFLGSNLEMVLGQIVAAERLNSPVIIAFNQHITPKIPMEIAIPMIVRAAEHAKVPVSSIFDHGTDYFSIEKSIRLGISSVMFDGSYYTFEENISMTREIVKMASAYGVSVEAELGAVGGSVMKSGGEVSNKENICTDPKQVREFIQMTGVDQLAISFGNIYGIYRGQSKLEYNVLDECFSQTEIPLVMHGGSGLENSDYEKIIQHGISKINYYSVMGSEGIEHIRDILTGKCPNSLYHELISTSIDIFDDSSAFIYELFDCKGKAKSIEINDSFSFSAPYKKIVDEIVPRIVIEEKRYL